MNTENAQITRLIRWNRFWLILVACFVLIGGFKYLESSLISNVSRLELKWGEDYDTKDTPALIFSSAGGGPFVVTHLAAESGGVPDTAISAIAELPHPFFVRSPKARSYIFESELKKLKWIDSTGKKVAPPKPGDYVQALYYETQKVMTGD